VRGHLSEARDFTFTNGTARVREWLADCAALLHERCPDYPVLYSETNGFDINTDRWTVAMAAWTEYIPADAEPYSWGGSDVDLPYEEDLTLAGGEAMQRAFEWYGQQEHRSDVARNDEALAQWLVWADWLKLLQAAWNEGPVPGVRVPLIATAHDFDVFLRLEPHAGGLVGEAAGS